MKLRYNRLNECSGGEIMQVSQSTNHGFIAAPKKESASAVNIQEGKLQDQKGELSTAKKEHESVTQEQKDQLRKTAVNYLDHQSKKSQVEIYLSVAADNSKNSTQDSTAQLLSSLRDVQKQNNAVAAYAAYKGEQQNAKPELF